MASLKLFLRRYQIDSTYVFSLMNYNKLAFDLYVENDLSSTRILNSHYKDIDTLPILAVGNPGKEILCKGSKEILRTLRDKKQLKKGIDFSVWETQGLEFIDTKVEPAMMAYTSGFKDKFHTAFVNTMMREPQSTAEALSSLKQVIVDTAATYARDKKYRIHSYRESRSLFQESLNEFESRMAGHFYYGGEQPNAADFRVSFI